MGWSIGYDKNWKRDIGYGVHAYCDHPNCPEEIDRGLAFVCGGDAYGGQHGCGLYFCAAHLTLSLSRPQLCEKCFKYQKPFAAKPEHPDWIKHKLTDESWQQWRDENPKACAALSNDELCASAREQQKP